MLLQDTNTIPPVLPVEVLAQSIPCVGGPRAAGEGALLCQPQESHIVYLGLVFHMDDRQLTPLDCGIHPVHTAAVCCHGPCGELNSTLRAWDMLSESHPVRVYHPRALQRHILLRHPHL